MKTLSFPRHLPPNEKTPLKFHHYSNQLLLNYFFSFHTIGVTVEELFDA
jgi:hypothetical protein